MFDLETEALVASGLKKNSREMQRYVFALDALFHRCLPKESIAPSSCKNARTIFDALWRDRPERYTRNGTFRLHQVIDAHFLGARSPAGNCLGLTVLFNCLLKRLGIEARALYLEHAFDIGPHVLTLIPCGGRTIDVENIRSDGFDDRGHKGHPLRVEWGDEELAADLYVSAGTESFHQGRFQQALEQYDQALKWNPRYEKARLNRAILLDRMQRESFPS